MYDGKAPCSYIFDNRRSIYAVYGNYRGAVGHAVTVKVRNNRLYLLNSLNEGPQRVAENNLRALLGNFEPYAYVFTGGAKTMNHGQNFPIPENTFPESGKCIS